MRELPREIHVKPSQDCVELENLRFQHWVAGAVPPFDSLRDVLAEKPVEDLRVATIDRAQEAENRFLFVPATGQCFCSPTFLAIVAKQNAPLR